MILTLPLGPIQTNCYLIADDTTRTAVAIDPGDEPEHVIAALHHHHLTLAAIWLTHAHFDHIGAVPALSQQFNVPVALHPADRALYASGGGARLFGFDLPPMPEPSLWLEPGQTLPLGAETVQVRFVPGHTLGHVAFYVPSWQAVFGGDVLFQRGIGRTDLPGADFDTLAHSIRTQFYTLPPATTVYPGHGDPTTIAEELAENPWVAGP